MSFFSRWLQELFTPRRRPIRRPQGKRLTLECLEDRVTPSVAINLDVPPNSPVGTTNAMTIQYQNTGTTAVGAPVLVVSANNANLWLPTDPAVSGSSLQVLATGGNGQAGTLAPGARGSIVVDYATTGNSASDIKFSVGQLTPGQTINWSALQASMKPSTIPPAAWPAVFANFTANLGSTTNSYQAALDADATYLALLGQPTNDIARLITYEINKADDAFSTTSPGSTVDASLPTPGGLSLSFQRWFQPGIAGHDQTGTLGLGWTNNWDITASTDSSGNVTINEAGSLRYFTKQSDGSYLGTLGDDGVLTALTGGGYQLKEADGSFTDFNPNGTLAYVQDSDGNQIFASYNGSGLLARLTAANKGGAIGESLTFTYNSTGLLTSVTASTGEITNYAYDGHYLLSATNEYGTTTYSYVTGPGAAQNALASITYANGSHAYYTYDSEGRLIDEHQDNGQQDVSFTFPAAGGYTATDALGNKTTVLTDDSGEVCETIDPLGNVTRSSYDASGNLLQVQGPQGADSSYTYDSNGNLLSETDPLGYTTTFAYNANNDLTSYTDAKGNTTSYAYDSSNDLLSITYANGTKESWNNYNPEGEAAQYVDANGQAISYQYNAQGLATQEKFSDGSTYTYTYNSHGNMLTATSSAGTIQFEYQDSANPDLLTEVLYPNGQLLKFSYNQIGQRTQSVDQTGYTINYTYDALGRLSVLTDGSGNLIVKYVYDADGNLIQQDNGNGTFTVYTYDGDGDVLSITNYAPSSGGTSYNPARSSDNSFDNYTYDALGNVLTDTNQDGKWVYTYDADSQLTGAFFTPNSSDPDKLTSQNIKYVYDADGNRISQTVNGVTTTYAVNNMNEYTSSTTTGVTTTYGYDKDGNLTTQTTGTSTTTYTYDELDELTGVSGPGMTASYTYDPLGNRNSETVNGVTTQFLIDPAGLGNVVSTYTSGSLTAHYDYGLGLVSQVSAAGIAGYYDFNLTGNTIGITGTTGSYVNKYSYQPFGQTTTITATLANPFTYGGQVGVMQDSTGLIDMRAREYSAVTGQFLSNDPTGLNGGDTNIRRYVGNNPLTRVDSTGLTEKNLPQLVVEDPLHPIQPAEIVNGPDGKPIAIIFNPKPIPKADPYDVDNRPYPLPTPPQGGGVNEGGGHGRVVTDVFDLLSGSYETGDKIRAGLIGIVDGAALIALAWPYVAANGPQLWGAIRVFVSSSVPVTTTLVNAAGAPAATGTTTITQSSVPTQSVVQGTTDRVFVGGYTAADGPYTPTDWSVKTIWSDGQETTDEVVPEPEDPTRTFLFYATRLFPTAGQVSYTTYITNLVEGWTGTGQGWVNVVPALAPIINGGAPKTTQSVSAKIIQTGDPPLVVIDTTDPSITSASQVTVSVGTANPTTPVPLVTGVTVTPLGGGVTQVVVNGVVSAVQPGGGEVYAAPLIITLGNEPPLTVQTVVDETQSDYTVNPANVVAVAGQLVQNVQVATVTGPANGNYSATINWGDGTSSTGDIVALGVGEYSVVGTKPNSYASSGTDTITVTVNGPGNIPAPAAQTTATVTANSLTPTVTLVSPLAGSTTGGTQVTITGTNLGTASTAKVHFGSTPATILSDNGTTILVRSPQGSAGPVNIIVTTRGGTSAVSSADLFTYIGSPSPSHSTISVASASIPTGLTTTVTLTVRDANGNQEPSGGLTVTFGLGAGSKGIFGPVTDNHNGTYTATFTATTVGRVTITATINGQAITSSAPTLMVTSSTGLPTPTVTVSDKGGTYNDQMFPATATIAAGGQTANSLEGTDLTLTYYAGTSASGTPLPAAPILAGTYTVVASFPGSQHYARASAFTTFTIKPATPTFSFVVRGDTAPMVKVTGVVGQPAASLEGVSPTLRFYANGNLLSAVPTQPGTYTAVAAFSGSQNYASATKSEIFTILPAVTFQVSPPARVTAGAPFSVTITARDSRGYLVTSFNGSVTLYGEGLKLGSVTLTNGVGKGQFILDGAGTIVLTAVGEGIGGNSGLTTIAPAAASSVQVLVPPTVTAGVAFGVTILAKDAYGNGCTGLVSLTTSDGQGGTPTWVSLVNGAGTAMVTLDKADSLTLKATLNGTTGTSKTFTVSPAGPASFTITAPSTATAGTGFTVSLTALDAFGNTVTSFTGGVVLLSSDGQPVTPNVVSLIHGVGKATVTLNKADTTALSVIYSNAVKGTSGNIVVSSLLPSAAPGQAITFQVSPPAAETAGSAFNVIVTAKDAKGNTVTGYNGSVTLYGEGLQLGTLNLVHGVGTAKVTLKVATTTQLVAEGGGLSGVSGLTTVLAAAPSTIQVIVSPVVTAGSAFAVTIIAKDAYGNGCTGLVTLTTSDGQGGTPTWVSVVNGVGTALVTLDKADSLTLKASLKGVVGTSNSFTVLPAGLASFVVSAPSSATAGKPFAVTVTAMDAFGNVVTGFTGGVALLCSDSQVATPNVVSLTNGVGKAQITLEGTDPLGLTADSNGVLGESGTIFLSAGA